ncbi:response regulator transcription factor [Frankia sp. R43]|uniref:response regulator transcription factor n=1 Tax=Frankia sp. R43 TaxID=269536 RepID=UPI0021009D27|nr:response regulator transcription factor [Frankia sp. R43]
MLADDHPMWRSGLARLLTAEGFTVVEEVGDADALRAAVSARRPDLAIVDIRMPPGGRLDGLEAAIDLRRSQPGLAVLVVSEHLATAHVDRLIGDRRHGVGYLLKARAGEDDFLDAVRRVAGGGCAFDRDIVEIMLGATRRRTGLGALTDAERKVLERVAQGRSNAAVSLDLQISRRTVEAHIRSIFDKLGLHDDEEHNRRVMAVLIYLRAGAG